MAITVYQHKGYDGKIKQFVYGSGYYPYIYKQRSLVFTEWIDKLQKRLIKAKYSIEQINNIVTHCINKGYYIADKYYIKPDSLVQRINDLGYKDLECV